MKLHCEEFRCPGIQENNSVSFWHSPPDIPQIWNGRFCTLIYYHILRVDAHLKVRQQFKSNDKSRAVSDQANTVLAHQHPLNLYGIMQ